MKTKIQLVSLTQVNLINRDMAFTGWLNSVQEWMKQWTVENNYRPVPIIDGDWTVAAKVWRDQLLDLCRQHFSTQVPEWARASFEPMNHFQFKFYISDELVPGEECFLKSHNYHVELTKIDQAAEDFAHERRHALMKVRGELEGQEER